MSCQQNDRVDGPDHAQDTAIRSPGTLSTKPYLIDAVSLSSMPALLWVQQQHEESRGRRRGARGSHLARSGVRQRQLHGQQREEPCGRACLHAIEGHKS